MLEYLYGNRFGSKIALANRREGDREGRVRVQKQVVEGNDPHGGHGRLCEGDRVRVGVSHRMAEVTLLCFMWLSPFLQLV
jgi:hypothetical protein